MKKLLLALSLVSFSGFATELTSTKDVEIKVLNGKEVSSDTVIVPDGVNQIVVRYKANLAEGSKNRLFESKPYVIQFTSTGQDLLVGTHNYRKYAKAEFAFKNGNDEWFVRTTTASPVSFTVDVLPGNPGFLPYNDLEKAVATYNKNKGIYFEGSEVKDLSEVAVEVKEDGKVEITGDALTQLKLWYTKASKEERKTFRKWMVDQD